MKRLPVIFLLALSACDGTGLLQDMGLSKEPSDPVLIDILCDASIGAPCKDGFKPTLEAILPHAAKHAGSEVRLWLLGNTPGKTKLVTSQTVEELKASSLARRRQVEAFVETGSRVFTKALESTLASEEERTRSPILESLTKLSFADTPPGTRRVIVVISDAREYSHLADFECGDIPTAEAFVESLHAQSILPPASLEGIRVTFTFTSLDEIPNERCEFTLARAVKIQDTWKAALAEAGARVEFKTGPITPDDLEVKQ